MALHEILSKEDRVALRAHWLGESLPADLARLFSAHGATGEKGRRRDAAMAYLRDLPQVMDRAARRMVLTYVSTAVARLVELMRGDSAETARKAAVDLLRLWERSVRDEAAAEACTGDRERRRLAENLSNEELRQMWAILANARERGADDDA